GNAIQKADLLPACQMLSQQGFDIYATSGTWRYLQENGVPARRTRFPDEAPDGTGAADGSGADGRKADGPGADGRRADAHAVGGPADGGGQPEAIPSAVDLIQSHRVDLVVNIPKNFTHGELTNGYRIRRAAIDFNVPLITNSRLATAYIRAFCALDPATLPVKAWDEYR
ncbi:MAG: hypothetical protein II064_03550, partial [Bacteroidales bacterium]|nr:hypothetical protein [Bacteroidales bacterium]